MEPVYVETAAIAIRQPIGLFYVTVIDAYDLYLMSAADVRRLIDSDLDLYLGIQRKLDAGRVAQMKKYVRNVDATFPTGIILHMSSDLIEFRETSSTLKILRRSDAARILDGQHRIAALEDIGPGEFGLNVAIFVDADIEVQANIFATVNLTQTKVNKSLVYDLYEFAKARSPQKSCHQICRLLNRLEDSPFFERIKILGQASNGTANETLTQALFVENLMQYISREPMVDRDHIRRGLGAAKVEEKYREKLFLRRLWIEEKEEIIAAILFDYFKAVEAQWPKAWNASDRGLVLGRTTGFVALMRLLPDIFRQGTNAQGALTQEFFASFFKRVPLEDADFNSGRYLPGSQGQVQLYNDLREYMLSPKIGA